VYNLLTMYDLVIIGGGPGGVSAGVYAARKRLKTAFVSAAWGGQSVDSMGVENWIGTVSISGVDLGKALENHLKAYAGDVVDLKVPARATKIEKKDAGFTVSLDTGENLETHAVLLTLGSTRRKLDVPGAKEYESKGISYCASCDAPLFGDQDVVVVGGGNAAFEAAAQLLAHSKTVTIIHRSDEFRADPVTVEKVLANPKTKAVKNAELTKIEGEAFLKSVTYKDKTTGEETTLPVTGLFVEIGLIPSTELAKGVVEMNEYNQILVDPRTQATNVPGIWAAGDCTDGLYHQNNIASGDAVKALEDIYIHLHKTK
jgi:alkyl hydroperoxide reductase subunit F